MELIATRPCTPRDQARLMVVRSGTGELEHARVCDLPDLLEPADVLVRNRSRVLPARLETTREDSGGRVGGLYLHSREDGCWVAMLRSNGTLRAGIRLVLDDDGPILTLIEREGSHWVLACADEDPAMAVLQRHGRTPLPPYILRARGDAVCPDAQDRRWYQKIYADEFGSVAAPTAGLHFTPELDQRLRQRGLTILEVILHVGPGTFSPVTAPTLEAHQMHSEHCQVDGPTLRALSQVRPGGRIVAVGTTTARVLESIPSDHVGSAGFSRQTDLLIAPGHHWSMVDVLLTNFHLPRSTLLALVAAKIGVDLMHEAYDCAVRSGYRFYSYGDAMLLL
jgi:S-adenosylmethionine:tRNA ribosyltransferase-isomerase